MNRALKSVIVAVAVLATGAVRLSFEETMARDLRHAGLAPPPLEIDTRERIGQTSSAVALGGLRTLVATFLNLRAFTAFTEKRWADVEETFHTIVDLAPRTSYYWDAGSWHMAYNASGDFLENKNLPPLRRREAWRAAILKGRAFLERGIRNNPEDADLLAKLGAMLSDKHKAFEDNSATFTAAADAYRKAAETGKALPYVRRAEVYALARVPGKEAEALALAKSLYAKGKGNRPPTLLCLLLVLESRAGETKDPAGRALELFGTPEKAYAALSDFWRGTQDLYPVDGVAAALKSLETRLLIPPERSVLGKQ